MKKAGRGPAFFSLRAAVRKPGGEGERGLKNYTEFTRFLPVFKVRFVNLI